MAEKQSHALQLILSLVVAAIIVWIAIAVTTTRLPLDRLPEEQTEELQKEREDRIDDRRDAREDAGDDDNSGSGS